MKRDGQGVLSFSVASLTYPSLFCSLCSNLNIVPTIQCLSSVLSSSPAPAPTLMMDQFYEIFMLFGICLATPLIFYLIFIAVKKPMPVRS